MANLYRPVLQFETGVIATSVVLVGAGLATIKDASAISLGGDHAWALTMMSFIGWMAVVVVVATLVAGLLQMRRAARTAVDGSTPEPEAWEKALAFLPVVPGAVAALQLIVFAARLPDLPVLFWRL